MNIPSFKSKGIRWTPEKDALLGTMPDRVLGEKIGFSRSVICGRRYVLKIPPVMGKYFKWTPETEKLLGTALDEDVAEMLGTEKRRVRAKRCKSKIPQYGKPRRDTFPWKAWEIEKCREIMSAEEVAKAIDRSVDAVWSRRYKLGLRAKTGIARSTTPRPIDDINNPTTQ